MTNCELLRHTIRLSNNCRNFDIEIGEIFKIIAVSFEKHSNIWDYSVLNTTDDEFICGQWNL